MARTCCLGSQELNMDYRVPFIRPCYQRFFVKHREEIMGVIGSCLERGELTLRQEVWSLERKIADYVGTKYAAGVASGTDALFLSLKALGIGPGDEVITVSNTFIATLQAIVHCGATPILVDVNEDEQMNVRQLEEAITPRTKAIIPVHYTGAMADMGTIMHIANEHGIYVVEDFCQALGATQDGKKAGSFGILNSVSFNTAKLLGGFCDGGMVTTDDRQLYEKVCLLRNHWNVHQLSVDRNDYPQPEAMGWGWKSRLSNINAAFIGVKFNTIGEIHARRGEIAKRYNAAFVGLPLITPHENEGRIWQEYHLRSLDRAAVAAKLKDLGVETLTRDVVPNHKMEGLGLSHWDLPVTEKLAREVFRLPLHEHLTDEEVELVIDSVKRSV